MKNVEHSTLTNFQVSHCGNELSTQSLAMIAELANSNNVTINVANLCSNATLLNATGLSSASAGMYRLRGFFCKVAALITSPYDESLLIDLDAVFFRQPELLFDAPAYTETGALFFRARNGFRTAQTGRLIPAEALAFFAEHGINATRTRATTSGLVNRLFRANGVNLFWKFGGNTSASAEDTRALSDVQDSSIVVFDRRRHPRTLQLLREFLPTFDVGWGDKEIFWMTATIAGEPFSFSPFLAGQYGDCDGVMLHFDPSEGKRGALASPLYANSEKMVEKELSYVGDYLSEAITEPVLVDAETVNATVRDMRTWSRWRHESNCTCSTQAYRCSWPAPASVTDRFLLSEWLTLSSRHRVHGSPHRERERVPCVPVHADYVGRTLEALDRLVPARDAERICSVLGCPALHLHAIARANTTANAPRGHSEVCVPIDFHPSRRGSGHPNATSLLPPSFSCEMESHYGDGRLAKKRSRYRVCYLH